MLTKSQNKKIEELKQVYPKAHPKLLIAYVQKSRKGKSFGVARSLKGKMKQNA